MKLITIKVGLMKLMQEKLIKKYKSYFILGMKLIIMLNLQYSASLNVNIRKDLFSMKM